MKIEKNVVVDVGGKRARGPSEEGQKREAGRSRGRRRGWRSTGREESEREKVRRAEVYIYIRRDTVSVIYIHLLLLDFERIEFMIKFAP